MTLPTQREGIDRARKVVKRGGRIHVAGAAEDEMRADEAQCGSKASADALVVFHPDAQTISPGVWWCGACGEASGEGHA